MRLREDRYAQYNQGRWKQILDGQAMAEVAIYLGVSAWKHGSQSIYYRNLFVGQRVKCISGCEIDGITAHSAKK